MFPNIALPPPRTTDLGAIDGPLLVAGGAYSNLGAFEAMRAEADRRGIPPRRILHTGDVVAYCADPAETAAALMRSGIPAIAGNVERQLAADAGDCGCGFEEGTACSALSVEWYAHARAAMTPGLRRWMDGLPDRLTLSLAGFRLVAIHGGMDDVSRFLFASTPDEALEGELARTRADGVIAGHSGLPFTREVGGRLWHNSGALGMPANDGTPRVWVSVLTPETDGIRIEHVPLAYDHAAAARRMRERGLPEAYARALLTGLWPSLDVLPPAERRATGAAIRIPACRWRRPPAARAAPAFAPAASS